jgi:hypothetical protein
MTYGRVRCVGLGAGPAGLSAASKALPPALPTSPAEA